MTEHKEMPNPTAAQRSTSEFEALWQAIKDWDINVPDYYDGYCGATGSHVALIMNALGIDGTQPVEPLPAGSGDRGK